MASNFRTDIEAFIDVNLSPEARSKALAATAIEERDKLIVSGQASKRYVTFVDGIKNPDESKVKGTGGGIIHYQFNFLGDAAQFAMEYLRLRVPKWGASGLLSQRFWMSIDNQYIPPQSNIDYQSIAPGATIVIGNTQAYWRKADVNMRGRSALGYRQPHELDDCVRAVLNQFGRTAIKAVRLMDYNFPNKYQPVRSPARKPYRYQSPVIQITAV